MSRNLESIDSEYVYVGIIAFKCKTNYIFYRNCIPSPEGTSPQVRDLNNQLKLYFIVL